MRQLTAEEIYNELIKDKIINSTGNITFTLNGLPIKINTKDSVGNMLQDWLESWAKSKSIYFRANPSTQTFPDFYLTQSNDNNFLEIKSFDYNASPNFDIANFEAYFRSLLECPHKLNAKYLIFGYSLKDGNLKIEKLWLKNIWEICTKAKDWDLKMQVSHDIVKNIRPSSFHSTRKGVSESFSTKQEFLEAIQGVLNKYKHTKDEQSDWLKNFKDIYKKATGINL